MANKLKLNLGVFAILIFAAACSDFNLHKDDDHENELQNQSSTASTSCPWSNSSLPLSPPGILSLSSSDKPTLEVDAVGPHGPLSVEKVKQDFSCYKQILELTYAGKEHFKDINFIQRIDDAINNISSAMSIDAMLTELFKVHEGAVDSHFMLVSLDDPGSSCEFGGAVHSDVNCRYFKSNIPYRLPFALTKTNSSLFVSVADHDLKINSCEGLHAAKILSASTQQEYILTGQATKVPATVSCKLADGSQKTFNVQEITSTDPSLNSFGVDETSTMIKVRVPEMTTIDDSMQKFIDLVAKPTTAQSILIDLRHNQGGENDFAEALEKALKTTQQTLVALKKADKQSVLSYTSFANYWYDDWKSLYDDGEDSDQSKANFFNLQVVVKDFLQDFSFDQVQEQIEADDAGKGERVAAYDKPIMVLYDKQCVSACESVLDRLKNLANVTFVGVPSYGAMHISQAGRLWLPNSHILVKAGFERWIYPTDIDAPEGFGHEPDYYIIEADPVKALKLATDKLIQLGN